MIWGEAHLVRREPGFLLSPASAEAAAAGASAPAPGTAAEATSPASAEGTSSATAAAETAATAETAAAHGAASEAAAPIKPSTAGTGRSGPVGSGGRSAAHGRSGTTAHGRAGATGASRGRRRGRHVPPPVPAAAGPVPPEDGPVDHRRNGHGTIAAAPAAVAEAVDPAEQDQQHQQQNDHRDKGGDQGTDARTGLPVKEQMGLGKEGYYALVPLPGRGGSGETAPDILSLRVVEPVRKASAGQEPGIRLSRIDEEDSVVLAQLQLTRPVPGSVLNVCAVGSGIAGGDNRHDAPRQLIPVGVIDAQGVLRLIGEDVCLVHDQPVEFGSGQIFVQRRAAPQHLHGGLSGQAPQGGQGDGRDEDQGRKGPVFQ